MKPHVLYLTIASLIPSLASAAECNPVDFLVQDITNVNLTDEVKTAFLLVATKEQYDRATQGGRVKLGYGDLKADIGYDQAKNSALKEASMRKYTYSRDYYVRYLSQVLSPVGGEAYAKCLEQDRQSPGLRLWLDKAEGPYYRLKGFWIGRDTTQGLGYLNDKIATRGFEVIQVDKEWTKGQTYEVVLQKQPDVDAFVSIKVGDESASYISVVPPPPLVMANAKVENPDKVGIGTGGSHDDKSEWNQPKSAVRCVSPTAPGRYLLQGSGNVSELAREGTDERASWQVTKDDPNEICITFRTSTGDKKVRNKISGKAYAFERFVVMP
ncbi:hypothetical protein HJC05_19975 [Rhizobium sp. NLR9a]|uniref:hypothetical protein n=1 Tax=unclassified Rhizobium TaxID=2613769 RepID=UPI001C82994D|nr:MULTISPECIES: hypothetical protein [unclassified Rhizobium]MBX5216469.1 hypothetical protein [Rhizobium sp. NLR9a]MBX5277849.1 hypothetical protein [Rhizobium sp. NLR13a]